MFGLYKVYRVNLTNLLFIYYIVPYLNHAL